MLNNKLKGAGLPMAVTFDRMFVHVNTRKFNYTSTENQLCEGCPPKATCLAFTSPFFILICTNNLLRSLATALGLDVVHYEFVICLSSPRNVIPAKGMTRASGRRDLTREGLKTLLLCEVGSRKCTDDGILI